MRFYIDFLQTIIQSGEHLRKFHHSFSAPKMVILSHCFALWTSFTKIFTQIFPPLDSPARFRPCSVIPTKFLFLRTQETERILAEGMRWFVCYCGLSLMMARQYILTNTAPVSIDKSLALPFYRGYYGTKLSQFGCDSLVHWSPISSWVCGHDDF